MSWTSLPAVMRSRLTTGSLTRFQSQGHAQGHRWNEHMKLCRAVKSSLRTVVRSLNGHSLNIVQVLDVQ